MTSDEEKVRKLGGLEAGRDERRGRRTEGGGLKESDKCRVTRKKLES